MNLNLSAGATMPIRFSIKTLLVVTALTAMVVSYGYRLYVDRTTLQIQISHQRPAGNRLLFTLKSETLQNVLLTIRTPWAQQSEAKIKVSANQTYEVICDPGRIRIETLINNTGASSPVIFERLIPPGAAFNLIGVPPDEFQIYRSSKSQFQWVFYIDYYISLHHLNTVIRISPETE